MKKRCGILKYRLRPATIRCRSGTVVHRISTPATSKPFLLQLQIPVVHDYRVTPYLQSPLIITISNLKSRNCRLIPLCILRVAITKSSWELQSQPHNCRGNRNLDTKPPCRLQFSNKKYLNLRCCFFPLSLSLFLCADWIFCVLSYGVVRPIFAMWKQNSTGKQLIYHKCNTK